MTKEHGHCVQNLSSLKLSFTEYFKGMYIFSIHLTALEMLKYMTDTFVEWETLEWLLEQMTSRE